MMVARRSPRFVLTVLAAGLAIAALVTYLAIRQLWIRQLDASLVAARDVLVAAVKIDDDSVQWQPSEKTLRLGAESQPDTVQWAIVGDGGQLVDGSRGLDTASPTARSFFQLAQPKRAERSGKWDQPTQARASEGPVWRLLQSRLAAPAPPDEDLRNPDAIIAFVITVARPTTALDADLWRLLALLTLVPVGIWFFTAIAVKRSGESRVSIGERENP